MDNATAWHVPIPGASLYGKLPTVLDYVRVNHSYDAAIALDEWLQRCIQDLALANVSWSSQRMRFLFAPPQLEHCLVGTIVGSRDRAGRKFPLAIFTALPVAPLRGAFASVPLACDSFLSSVEALLDDTKSLDRDELPAKLSALPVPNASDFETAKASVASSMSSLDAATFANSAFGEDAQMQAPRAYAVALTAAHAARERPSDRPSVLDCPVREPRDVVAWLALLQSVLQWRVAVPSLFWSTEGDPGRLLVSLGAAQPSISVWMADRKRKADKLLTLPPMRMSSQADQLLDKLVSAAPDAPEESVAERFAQLAAMLS